MEYRVGKIPAAYSIDTDKHGAGRERKKGHLVQRAESHDSISISDEARQRSADEEAAEEALSGNQVTK
ncbi:hypothetical protein [Geotalea sp. SG265]|uniref:hypothetical protein n=1 Tax=Geotalea sp. SG265 TaxID=2922867 RepID=UPI001FAFE7E9|nr:hypothetical protein [Geotalea sp. SG265]